MLVEDIDANTYKDYVLHLKSTLDNDVSINSYLRDLITTIHFDVAVDLRPDSPTFGRHVAVELTEDNHRQVFIPKGFAHGFSVLSEEAVFQYKCDAYYAPQSEGGVAWDDPDLAIDWKIPKEDAVLSGKDERHPRLRDIIHNIK